MSLCSMVNYSIKRINTSNDLVQAHEYGKMNYINQQGSWISVLTKLISKITIMLGENNLLNYSESCTSEVQDDAIIEGY